MRVKTLSWSMLLYLCVHLVCSSLGIPHLVYKVGWWKPMNSDDGRYWRGVGLKKFPFCYCFLVPSAYAPYMLFLTGAAELNYLTVESLCTFFLVLERCLLLQFVSFSLQQNKWYKWTSLFIVIAVYSSSLANYLMELPLDLQKGFWIFSGWERHFRHFLCSYNF